ncbi:serine/threonine-protein kinase Nek1-like [Diadema antillarum]|uniref:serine/threonine-protein kinase Nek1-like n=1 Tax=Diadema antillarum TaxID=105358 RepID=UPI003A84F368
MDRYVKKRQIGEGSFGKALLVQSKQDGKEYVIKEINISKMKRKEREESKKEVSVLKKMRHPNIVSYAESFEERGNLYIVMDYCDGGDLFKAINNRRGVLFPEDQVMDWFVQICLALKHVHDRKILHRDIKSQNIFLTRKGIVKMGDFGIARVLNNTMELARTCIGTPYYLSPEICENKPYNNKSDIWALGCVLYEILTLKHAFEAGNMKNLVLKIIRGSYPPVSPRYSYDIRNLVAQLFKRNPRDRPSINSVLKKPFVQKRIQKFLTDAQIDDEFSHTVFHRNDQPANRVAAPFQRPVSKPPVSAAAKRPPSARPISNPAAKYGPSVAVNRPPSGVRKSVERDRKAAAEKDLEQKKKDLIEKERERRLKEKQVKAQQQQLINKQRMASINKAREAGWKNTLLSSGGSSNGGGGGGGGGGGAGGDRPVSSDLENGEPAKKELKLDRPASQQGGKADRGNYDHYHQFLDNLRNQGNGAQVGQGGAAMFREDREQRREEEEAVRRQIRDRPVSASAAEAARRGQDGRLAGANAAERARMVNDFLARKREAAANKARAAVQLGWAPPSAAGDARNEPLFPYGGQEKKAKNREEQAYLDQLKAIRMQNYQERLNIRKGLKPGDDPKVSADARRKKIEALKAQADLRAAKLKEQLEKQRREAYEKEKRAWDEHLNKKRASDKPVSEKPAAPKPVKGPAVPVVGLTAALRNVGVDIPQAEEKEEFGEKEYPENKSEEAPAEVSQAPAAPRKRWGGGETKGSALANMPLEVTASNMEATGVADVVTRNPAAAPSVEAPSAQANRKKWGAPGNTVVNALQMAEIKAGTMTMVRGDDKGKPVSTTIPLECPTVHSRGSPMGVTIIKDHPMSPRDKLPVVKDTMVVTEVDSKQAGDVKESADLETIDAKNEKDAVKTGGGPQPGNEKDPPQGKAAWSGEEGTAKQAQKDASSQQESSSPSSREQSRPKTPRSPLTPPSTPPTAAPPSVKTTPPKSPKPDSLSPPKRSPPSSSSSSARSPRQPDDQEKDSPEKDALDIVDLEDDDEEEEDAVEEYSAKKKMIAGLSTGFFDTAPRLLRTCSDPDLRQLFRTTMALNPFFAAEQESIVAQSIDVAALKGNDVVDEDEDDDEESAELIRQLTELTARKEEEEEEEEEENQEDEIEDVVDEEEEEYQSLVESMKSLLEARDAADTPQDDGDAGEEAGDGKTSQSSPSSPDKEDGDGGDEEEEDEKENSGESKPINEDWDSGEGSEGEESGMSAEERESVFSRLEESRLQLEKELGCDTFLKAYKSIQAMHEDEDENIEEGTKRVNDILGEGKGQLYTKILQLVMADGAYTEDNDD